MSLTIDVREIGKARQLVHRAGDAITKSQYRAVNYAAKRSKTEAGRLIRADVKLKAAYVNSRLSISRTATPDAPVGVLSAKFGGTSLGRYGAKQLTKKAPSRRAEGDPRRGIPAGRKQDGVSVHVMKAGSRKKMRKAFIIPSDRDVPMIFTRTGPGRGDIEFRLGPSVHQMFRSKLPQLKAFARPLLVKEYFRLLRVGLARGAA